MINRPYFVREEQEEEESIDVCQICGTYFGWSASVKEANAKLGSGSQRCLRCALT